MIAGEVIAEITKINYEKSQLPLKVLALSTSLPNQAITTSSATTSSTSAGLISIPYSCCTWVLLP